MKQIKEKKYRSLSEKELYRKCDLSFLQFRTTEEVSPLTQFVGQPRAISALEFGLSIRDEFFHIYAAGPPGTGKFALIMNILEGLAKKKPTPPDWVYVHNFEDPSRPRALDLPPGKGREFADDMKNLVENLKREIVRTFESELYSKKREELIKDYEKKKETLIQEFSKKAKEYGFLLKTAPAGFIIIPAIDGKPLSPQEYEMLKPELKEEFERKKEEIERELQHVLKEAKKIDRKIQEELKKLDKDFTKAATSHFFEELKEKYRQNKKLLEYLEEVEEDVLQNFDIFRRKETLPIPQKDPFTKYRVNVLVDNSGKKGAPIVHEPFPNYYNILGRIEKEAQMGMLVTDFTLITAGALHRANGGFLVIQVEELFKHPFAYEALKSALKSGKIQIEDIGERFGIVATKSLKPEPIPCKVKVILLGDPIYYHLLYYYDPEFKEIFKVKAQFDTEMERNEGNIRHYASFISYLCRKEGLKHFDRSAVARIVEYGSRLVENKRKLSTQFAEISDVVRESSYWAEKEGSDYVKAQHVDKALKERVFRSNLVEEKIQEMIKEGQILVDTRGERVGVVNGLSIIHLGDFRFGRPVRITVSVGSGKDGVVDVERESGLGGKLHTKALMIWSGYFMEKYAYKFPVSLSAKIAFEQSYEGVEGDSASSAELFALLSELSGIPIKQGIAVTGSVNQKGEIQPVGGINEKIEGFYKVCKIQGLTGEQGVIIPKRNLENLMLDGEVREAVKQGKFKIFAIENVDEGLEILTGVPAGKRRRDGTYEPGTIHGLVEKKLKEFQEALKEVEKAKKSKRKTSKLK